MINGVYFQKRIIPTNWLSAQLHNSLSYIPLSLDNRCLVILRARVAETKYFLLEISDLLIRRYLVVDLRGCGIALVGYSLISLNGDHEFWCQYFHSYVIDGNSYSSGY